RARDVLLARGARGPVRAPGPDLGVRRRRPPARTAQVDPGLRPAPGLLCDVGREGGRGTVARGGRRSAPSTQRSPVNSTVVPLRRTGWSLGFSRGRPAQAGTPTTHRLHLRQLPGVAALPVEPLVADELPVLRVPAQLAVVPVGQ